MPSEELSIIRRFSSNTSCRNTISGFDDFIVESISASLPTPPFKIL
jgi:hypothetical protein